MYIIVDGFCTVIRWHEISECCYAEEREMLKNQHRVGMGILTEPSEWVLLADINGQLKFPSEVATTRLRPDLITCLTSAIRIFWRNLTCPCEERLSAAHELKFDQ